MGGKAYLGHLRKGQFGNGLNRGLKISIDQPLCNSIRHRTRVVGFRYIFDHKQLIGRQMFRYIFDHKQLIGRQISPWKLDRPRLLTAQPNLQCLMFSFVQSLQEWWAVPTLQTS
jgi:hypothetical protein